MDHRALHKIIARGIYELGIEDDFADMVGNAKGWEGGTRKRRVRLSQWLGGYSDRNADLLLAPLAMHAFGHYGRGDLCDEIVGVLMKARWEGEREREELPERRQMLSVRPGLAGRSRSAAG